MNLIKQKIIEIVSVPPKRKGDTGCLKLTEEEIDKIVDLFKETIQYFIEETTKKAEKWDDLYNWDTNRKVDELIFKKKLLRKQQKWLKENL